MQRTLDLNGDFVFGGGKLDYMQGLPRLKQDLTTRLKEWTNDCFFNKPAGIDYLNLLDIGGRKTLEASIRSLILQTKDVRGIESFNSSVKNRRLYVDVTLDTIYGVLVFQATI